MISIWIFALVILVLSTLIGLLWYFKRKMRHEIADKNKFIAELNHHLQLRQREATFFENSFDSMQEAVLWINLKYQIFRVNQSATNLYQYSKEAFQALSLEKIELQDPDYPFVLGSNFWNRLKKQDVILEQAIHQRKNGSSFWAEIHIQKIVHCDEPYACVTIRNISKQKRRQFSEQSIVEKLQLSEYKLKQSEQQIRYVIESTQDEIFALDHEYRLCIANTAFLNCMQQMGVTLQIGDSVLEHLPKSIREQWSTISETKKSYLFEEVIRFKNGQTKHVEIITNTIQNAHNTAPNTTFFVRDTSERKKAEKTLKISENRLKSLMQNLQGMVYRLANDEQQTALFISAGVTDLMGITPEQFTNRQEAISPYIISHYQKRVEKKVKHAFALKKSFEAEYPILIKGKTRWFLEKAHPVQINNKQLILEGFITDITHQIEAEEKLRRSEELLRNYMIHTPANMFIKNLAGEYMKANPHLCKMLGLEISNILDSTDYELYDEDIADKITQHDMQVLTTHKAITYEQTIRLSDQTKRTLITSKFPLKDQNDQVYAIGGISFDITHRKKAEQELVLLKDDLEGQVRMKTQKIQNSNKRLTKLIADYRYQTQKLQDQENMLLQNMDRLNQINTMLKNKQQEINTAHERFEILHSGANEGLWDWHFSTQRSSSEENMWVSEKYKKLLLGKKYLYKAENRHFSIHDWKKNLHIEDKEIIPIALKNHLDDRTGKTSYDVEFRVKVDGHYRWFRECCTTIRDPRGCPTRSVGSLQDITDEKLLKSKIDHLLIRYDLAFSSTKEGIWDIKIEKNGSFSEENIWISPQLKKLWQISDVENWLMHLTPKDKVKIRRDLISLIHDDVYHQSLDKEYFITLPDKTQRWFRAVGSTVRQPDSKRYTRIAGIISDITDKKELERLKENLQEEVSRKTRKLSHKNQQLTQALQQLKYTQANLVNAEKMASLGQLTAGIAHEINNPVSYIGSSIEGLKISIADLLEVIHAYEEIGTENVTHQLIKIKGIKEDIEYDEVMESLTELTENISTGVKRTAQIVKGLRRFSRLDEDTLKKSNLHHGIDSTLLLLRNKTKGRIEIIKHYSPEIEEIECFPGQLNQVFMNILSNAIQAIHGDGKIFIETTLHQGYIKICITDTGTGISDRIQHKIFEPFFTTKDVGEGTGLGLSISYGIMERHHGSITAENTAENGARFTIMIPKKIPKR